MAKEDICLILHEKKNYTTLIDDLSTYLTIIVKYLIRELLFASPVVYGLWKREMKETFKNMTCCAPSLKVAL